MLTIKQQKWTAVFLSLVILIDFMGVATVVTLFPQLLLGTQSILPTNWTNTNKLTCMGIILAIYPLGQFLGATFFGKLSDTHGRKNMLLLTLVGTWIGFFLSALAVKLSSPVFLFLGRGLAGFFAGNVAIAQASLMDISTPETKIRYTSYGQMAMGSAYIIGPVLGALLSQSSLVSWFSASTPFWFFTIVLTIFVIITYNFFNETLIEKKINDAKINMLQSFQQIYVGLHEKKLGKALLIWAIFVSGWWLFEAYMPAFLLQSFHYSTLQIGVLLAFNGALYAAFQYFVVQHLAKKISAHTMASSTLCLGGAAIIGVVLAHSTIQLYFTMALFVTTMGLGITGLLTQISNLAEANDQGKTMGIVNSIQAIATVIVMLLGGYLNGLSNTITIAGGGLLVILSWVIFCCVFGLKRLHGAK